MNNRLPLAVYALALGTFCVGTSEFMLAGLLPQISADLDVSVPRAGLLISAFAIGMTLSAPVMALLTLRLPRRATLMGASAVFAVVHLTPFLLDGYASLMVSRVVAAVACATYWAAAAVVAVKISPPGATAKAMAAMVGGLTLANVLGVPGGTWVGDQLGWRASFLAVALATVAVAAMLVVVVPHVQEESRGVDTRSLVRRELVAFSDRRLWLALGTTATFQAAVFACFSYLAPLLTDVAGYDARQVPLILLLFGIGSFVGVVLGGRYADRNMLANVMISLLAMIASLVLLAAVSGTRAGAAAAVLLFGVAAFSIAAALNGRVFLFAGDAPTLAAAVNVSAFNVGNAVGPWLGGAVISAGYGLRAPIWTAVVLGVLALGLAATSRLLEGSGGVGGPGAGGRAETECAAVGA